MNKLKKSIYDLQSYLGRDSQGLGLLGKVARIANELNAEKKAISHSLESAKIEIEALKKLVSEQTAARLDASLGRESLLARITQLESKNRSLENDLHNAQCEKILPSRKLDFEGLVRCIRVLKHIFKTAPKFYAVEGFDGFTFYIEDVAGDYSDNEMANLGRLVAAFAITSLDGVRIQSHFKLTASQANHIYGQDGLGFMYWYRKNLDSTSDLAERSKFVGSKAEPIKSNG